MNDYLIRRTDGEWFDLHADRNVEAFRPSSFSSERIEGDGEYRIRTEGVEIVFSYEDPGIQVTIEGDLSQLVANQIVDEIRQNIERVTGQKGQVIHL